MTALETKADAEALINKEGVEYVSVRFTDLIGVQQHFTVPASEFLKDAFTDGMPFDGSSVEGFQAINESDMKLVPDVSTAFIDPFRKHKTLDVAFSIVDPLTDEPYSRDPRQVAGKAEAYLKSTGIADTASFAPEAEFFIFDKVRFENSMQRSFYEVDSVEAPWNTGVDTEDDGTPNIAFKNRVKRGYFPVPPIDHTQDLRDDMVANLQKVGLILERSHHEVAGAGQQEINYRFNSLQHAGDDLMKYKYVVHETAALAGKAATFMPKPIAGDNGTGMHCHQSLWKDGKPLFYDEKNYGGLSDIARWYIGGLIKHSSSVLAFTNPSLNSYHRLVPGFEAPVNLVYSARNRSAAIRIPLAGTSVKIRNADTGEWVVQHINYPSPMDIDTFVTDSTGTLMLPEALGFGNYELYEQQSPWGYVLDDEPVPFVVDGTQDVVTVTKYNTVQKGTITVHKEGEVFSHVVEAGGLYQPQYEVQGQPGAVYDITALEDIATPDGVVHAKAGELVATLTTGSDGTATSEPLYLGRYQVSERTAPAGMVLDPEPKEVTLAYAGQEVSVTTADVGFVNERQKVEISLKKLLEQDETFSIGMNEEWKNITFGLFAAEEIIAADGSSIPADGLIETTGIDENGNAAFKTDLSCGASLYVKEIGTDEHYLLSDEKYPVVFEYAGQDVATVQLEVNDGEAIENTLKYGKVSGWKVDQDGFELGGAVIGLFRFDETEFTEETALMVTESNPIGYFEFDRVPVGNWVIREIAAPEAFVLSEETFPVEITEDGQTIEITMENQIIRGTVETPKVDADFPENTLSGAIFEVYADVDHNGEFDPDIDKLVSEMAESEGGIYQLKDLQYGDYLLHEKEAPEFFQRDEGYYPFSITENGAIVRVETEAGVGFLNHAQTGSLKVVKTADDDQIEGRTFKITGTDFMGNAYEQEFQTDENGEINVTLRVGEYTVSEVAGEDAEQYILPDDQTVEIQAGETVTVAMHNKLVPEVPTVPQTGDSPWMPAVLIGLSALALLAGGGLLAMHLVGKKKRSAGGHDRDQDIR